MKKNSTSIDYLIVGQGLAGTLLARLLLQANKSIRIIDSNHRGSSTKIAAGIINPVTGRRYAKSWMFEELYPVAKRMYQTIEQETGLSLFEEKKLIRVLINAEQENEWHSRSSWEEMKNYMFSAPKNFDCQKYFKSVFGLATTNGAAQVNISKLIEFYQEKWLANHILIQEQFNYSALNIDNQSIDYQGLTANYIIFCEGHAVMNNPWFRDLPWQLSKGEVLHLEIPGYSTNYLLKHHLIYAPLPTGNYWVGSNYEWNATDEQPSEAGKSWLLKRVEKDLATDYRIVEHKAAFRPTVKHRRPMLGHHAEFPQLILFNGLGTKGTSLGPYFAQHLFDHLELKNSLNKEVDINFL